MKKKLFIVIPGIILIMILIQALLRPFNISGNISDLASQKISLDDNSLQSTQPILTGTIRWDAWIGDEHSIGRAVSRHITPEKWNNRMPFFTEIHNQDSITTNGLLQEIMDREIEYASGALDYWAFLYYSGVLGGARELYLSSSIKDRINFCLIIEGTRMIGEWDNFYQDLSRCLDDPGYQTVLDNRPLLYLFRPVNAIENKSASWEQVAEKVETIQKLATGKGYNEPYLVIMDYSLARIDSAMAHLNADAVSDYAVFSGKPGESYRELTEIATNMWEDYSSAGYNVVPFLTAGWDPRPRWDRRDIPWGYHDYGPNWSEKGTPEEIANHFKEAFNW
ncbi:MAG: hypothetical protein IH594_02990, partial [Bacteroidales bacterium]|nr:hypothetical protein [Bacteroidales bacterium]